MTIKKKVAAVAAAAMMAMSMTAISASASVGDSFSLSNYNTYKSMLVTDLNDSADNGIEFYCSSYTPKNDATYIEGNIPSNMKKRTGETAILNAKYDKEIIMFKTGWYDNGAVTTCRAWVNLYSSESGVSASGTVK